MAVISKNELKSMTPKAAEAKIAELEKAMLELHGEGKREKANALKKAIARLRTIISQSKGEKPKV